MSRTKAFQPESALHSAMDLFWQKGYEATSMRDLLDAMSIGRGSFYDTFGNKHSLFLTALDRFEKTRTTWIIEALESPDPPLESIRYVFERTVDSLTSFEPRRGCLLANTAVELAPQDPEVAEKILAYIQRTENAFANALKRARQTREIPQDRNPQSLACFLVSNLHGLRVMARAGADRQTLYQVVEVALSALS